MQLYLSPVWKWVFSHVGAILNALSNSCIHLQSNLISEIAIINSHLVRRTHCNNKYYRRSKKCHKVLIDWQIYTNMYLCVLNLQWLQNYEKTAFTYNPIYIQPLKLCIMSEFRYERSCRTCSKSNTSIAKFLQSLSSYSLGWRQW